MAGPIQNARTREPMAAEPTHHQATTPFRYPRDVAPTVEPAPMFAASIVEKTSPGPRRRPATKKSEAPATLRPIHRPSPISASEYEARRTRCRLNDRGSIAQARLPDEIAEGGNAGDAGRLTCGTHDGVGHGFGCERTDLSNVGVDGQRAGGEREDRVAVHGCMNRDDGSCEAVVRHLRDAGSGGLREPGVGGHDAQRRVLACPAKRDRPRSQKLAGVGKRAS